MNLRTNDLGIQFMGKELIDIFVHFGLTEKESKVLSLIIEFQSVPAINFEATLHMRQPEVSVVMKSLQARGWVRNGDKIKVESMQRASNSYELACSLESIITELHTTWKAKHTKHMLMLNRLNTIRRKLIYVQKI